jgi:hypothetical protein
MKHSTLVPRLTAIASAVLVAWIADAAPGDPDLAYGTQGSAPIPELQRAVAVLPLEDGGAVVLGSRGDLRSSNPAMAILVRFTAAGGVASLRELFPGYVGCAIRLRDGRVLLAGHVEGESFLLRLFADGTPDASFGVGGRLGLRGERFVTDLRFKSELVHPTTITELRDGDVVVGAVMVDNSVATAWYPAYQGLAIRVDPEGRIVSAARPSDVALSRRMPQSMVVLNDGRIVFAGAPDWDSSESGRLFGWDPDGTVALLPESPKLSFGDVLYQPLVDRILVTAVEYGSNGPGFGTPFVAALSTDGKPETAFGDAGNGRVLLRRSGTRALSSSARAVSDQDGGVFTLVASNPEYEDLRDNSAATLHVTHIDAQGNVDARLDGTTPVHVGDPDRWSRHEVGATAIDASGNILAIVEASGSLGAEWEGHRLVRFERVSAQGPGSVGFATSTLRLGEGLAQRTVRVLRNGGASGGISVRYVAESGTAGAADYAAVTGTLSWSDGDSGSREIALRAVDDDTLEGEESFRVQLLDPTGGATVVGGALVATIEDDEALRSLKASAERGSIAEGQQAVFVITPDANVPGPITVNALIADSIDPDGWPVHAGLNSSGVARTLISWPSGDRSPRRVSMGTNVASGTQADFSLNLRLADSVGLVSAAAGPTGARVTVTDAPPATTASPSAPAQPSPGPSPPSSASNGGGGALTPDTLALVAFALLLQLCGCFPGLGSARRPVPHATEP